MAIVLGLPKGSLQESTFALFKRVGFNVSCSSRSYVPSIDDDEIKCRLLRPQEMSRYVELGLLDAGICGYDWVYENGSDVQEICELNYSKATSNPVRWVLAVPNDSQIKTVKDLQGKRIATGGVGRSRQGVAQYGFRARHRRLRVLRRGPRKERAMKWMMLATMAACAASAETLVVPAGETLPVPSARKTDVGTIFPVQKTASLPTDCPVILGGKGRLVLRGVSQRLEACSGTGLVQLEAGAQVVFGAGSAFTGSVAGAGLAVWEK